MTSYVCPVGPLRRCHVSKAGVAKSTAEGKEDVGGGRWPPRVHFPDLRLLILNVHGREDLEW